MMTNESQINARAVIARMEEKTRQAVLAEMGPVQELARLAGRSANEMRDDLERWRAEGRIFSVQHEGVEYFPPFALDPCAGYTPYPAVAEVLRILHELEWKSSWGPASWFVGLNGDLDAQRPLDILADDPQWVIEAARDEVNSVKYLHG